MISKKDLQTLSHKGFRVQPGNQDRQTLLKLNAMFLLQIPTGFLLDLINQEQGEQNAGQKHHSRQDGPTFPVHVRAPFFVLSEAPARFFTGLETA